MPAWFDAFADAIESGDQRFLECESRSHATLPPCVCPACGSTDLPRASLSDRGGVLLFTDISVTIPKFHGETPYTVVLT